jgi:hypothetical protein
MTQNDDVTDEMGAVACKMRMEKAAKEESIEKIKENQTSISADRGQHPCRDRAKKKTKK